MLRYMLRLSYLGSHYRGSQKHSNGTILDIDSIQGSIESALLQLPMINNIPKLNLAGRTDAGVHALYTVAHVDLEFKYPQYNFDSYNMCRLLNRYLIKCGHDIRILSSQVVNNKFHARFSVKSRTYLYRFFLPKDINNHQIPIIESGKSMHVRMENFDIEKIKKGIRLFQGTKDFRTFCSQFKDKDDRFKSTVKTLHISLEEAEPLSPFDQLSNNFTYWHITFTSKSFLYNQIRRIVGALIALGGNKITEDDIVTMLQVPSVLNWNPRVTIALPCGLYLKNVEYDEADIQEVLI